MLIIKDLCASVQGREILKGLNLSISPGEIHVLMGPNGAGKSTLAKILTGHPFYEVSSGSIEFEGNSILDLEPEERARLGIFMSFQYPIEIPGVTNRQFLYEAYCSCKGKIAENEFDDLLFQKMQHINIRPEFKDRNLNEGFSGGEKKRNEILQLAILDPKLAILDETDSGLDIDAMKSVAQGVKSIFNPSKALLLITHYQRLLEYIVPHFVHIVVDGKIIETGGPEVALRLEKEGYNVS